MCIILYHALDWFEVRYVLCTEPKAVERHHKKKRNLPVTDPAKTSLILFDEVSAL